MARILVVDDATFMRRLVGEALRSAGHEIVGEAGDGLEAIVRFTELKPDLVTLDITMPVKDGMAALREILALNADARVVMCSAVAQPGTVHESMRLGARDFVVKPFVIERVINAVEDALAP